MKIHVLSFILLITASVVQATDFYRCDGAGGHVIFSQKPCGPDAVVETVPDSSLKGGVRGPSRSAIDQLENFRSEVRKVEQITGSENRKIKRKSKTGPCENVSTLALRNARVSKDVMKCHSMDDVRHIYGEPRSIDTWSDRSAYDTRWNYRNNNSARVYVYFKEGRVTRWRTHNKKN